MDSNWTYGKRKQKRAEALLLETRMNWPPPLAEEEAIVQKNIVQSPAEEQIDRGPLFCDFMLRWLAMMKHKVEFITYASYYNVVTNHVIPYFESKNFFSKNCYQVIFKIIISTSLMKIA